MSDVQHTATRIERARIVVAMLLLALLSVPLLATPVAAEQESPTPSTSPTAAEAACSSADDLRLILGFIDQSLENESGLIPVGIGVIAGLSEARTLAGLVREAYRPLVVDVVVSLQDMRDTLGNMEDLETAGAKLASIGESMVDIGNEMDALSVQLRTRCPAE